MKTKTLTLVLCWTLVSSCEIQVRSAGFSDEDSDSGELGELSGDSELSQFDNYSTASGPFASAPAWNTATPTSTISTDIDTAALSETSPLMVEDLSLTGNFTYKAGQPNALYLVADQLTVSSNVVISMQGEDGGIPVDGAGADGGAGCSGGGGGAASGEKGGTGGQDGTDGDPGMDGSEKGGLAGSGHGQDYLGSFNLPMGGDGGKGSDGAVGPGGAGGSGGKGCGAGGGGGGA